MAQSKATRKFERKHLKDVLKRRKEGKKVKQRARVKEKRKERHAADDQIASDIEQKQKSNRTSKQEDASPYGDMSVDEFFQGGFDVAGQPKQNMQNGKSAFSKTSKRKHTEIIEEDEDDGVVSSSDDSVEADPVADDSEPEAESDEEIDTHKKHLRGLQQKDPEFYEYIKQNDPELLEFAEDADLAEMDGLSGSEADDRPMKQKRKKDKKQDAFGSTVTKALIEKWRTAMTEKHSLRATKEVVLAFRSAAHVNEENGKEYKYSISSPDVYHEVVVLALSRVPEVLQHHLPTKVSNNGKVHISTEGKKFGNMTSMLKSHATSVMHLLSNLSDAATLRMTTNSIIPLLPYILSFKKLLRELAKTIIAIWSESSNTEATRIAAFLALRSLVVIGDAGTKESTLKTVYQGLVQGSRNTSVHTIEGVNLMKNSAVELWGLDPNIGYTTGFTFIRQLAIHLRSSIKKKTKESYKIVYNWQYVHSLDFWSRVVSSHCDSMREATSGEESILRPLIYPIVQITIGAMRLIPTAQYFPLRFQMIRSLLRISFTTSTYIPIAPALYEVLTSAEMRKPPKPATLKPLDFNTSIRATKAYLRTRVYQDGVGEQVVELLAGLFVIWSKNIAFPELALPVVVMLKRWLKDVGNPTRGNKNGKVNAAVGVVVQKLEANSRWIEERRAKVDFAPNNRAAVDAFLKETEWEKTPLGAYVVGQRKIREEKARLIENGRKAEERKKREEATKESSNKEWNGVDEVEGGDVQDYDSDGE